MADERTEWWLVERTRYGTAGSLADGPHDGVEGVEQALYLLQRMGLAKAEHGYAAARVTLTDVGPRPHGANEEALDYMAGILSRRTQR